METIIESRARRRKRLVSMEASEAWVEWLDGLADKAGTTRSATIDQALRRLAMHLRYESMPPKR